MLDEWLPIMTGAEIKVIMVIARQTYGWHKESEWISYSQFTSKTGLNQDSISTALKNLKINGYIEVYDKEGKKLLEKPLSGRRQLYYRINYKNSEKTSKDEKNSEKPSFKTRKIRDTKDTNTKEISNINITNGDKSPVGDKKNVFVESILKDFSDLTGLANPADRKPRMVAWNFHQKYGAENFRAALTYLQDLWKKDITKIETVKLHYPTYLRDVKKQSVTKLTKEQEELVALLAMRN